MVVPCLLAGVLLCLSAPAVAQSLADAAQAPADVATAKRWFKEAEEAEKRGDYRLALIRFEQALSVKATPQLHLRIGACQEKLGRIIEAQESYERALEKANAQALPAVAKVAEEQIQALRPRIPTVLLLPVKVYPGLSVAIDGVPVAPAALGAKVPINPGAHTLTAEAPGYVRREQHFSVVERDAQQIELNLLPAELVSTPPPSPAPSSTGPTAPASSAPPPSPDRPVPSRAPGFILVGGGAAAIAGGAALVVVSLLKDGHLDTLCPKPGRHDCPMDKKATFDAEIPVINVMRFSGIALGGVGVIGVATGAYLLASRPSAPAHATGFSLQVLPVISSRSVGVLAEGRF